MARASPVSSQSQAKTIASNPFSFYEVMEAILKLQLSTLDVIVIHVFWCLYLAPALEESCSWGEELNPLQPLGPFPGEAASFQSQPR